MRSVEVTPTETPKQIGSNLLLQSVLVFFSQPDYDDIEDENRVKLQRGKSDKGKDNKKYGKSPGLYEFTTRPSPIPIRSRLLYK